MFGLSPGGELLRAGVSSFLEGEDHLGERFGREPGCCLSSPREGDKISMTPARVGKHQDLKSPRLRKKRFQESY